MILCKFSLEPCNSFSAQNLQPLSRHTQPALPRHAYGSNCKPTTPQSPNGASSPYTGEPIEVRADLSKYPYTGEPI